jgi:hypothetical protein
MRQRRGWFYVFLFGMIVSVGSRPGWAQSSVFTEVKFAPEVHKVLERKIRLLEEGVSGVPVVIQAIQQANEDHKGLSLDEIFQKDRQWQEMDGVEGWVKDFLINPAAELLIAFQDADDHQGYSEIFITDARGLNVAMTNKTSDYYQADEDWWVKAYADGAGHAYYGDIEFDESAMTEAISVYIPLRAPETQHVIGIMKAVIDITAIKREL